MGNASGSATDADNDKGGSSRVWIFLHRTWTVMVAEKWTRSRLTRRAGTSGDGCSEYESQYSQYSFCSCSQCQRDDGFSSGCYSDLFESGSSMAPNSDPESGGVNRFPFVDDSDKQRPPIYNPEDYAILLKKWGKKSSANGMISLYSNSSTSDIECPRSRSGSFRDYRNPMLTSSGSEMTLRQFGTVSEMLAKLKSDLRLAYPSFVQEFVADPLDGITLLLDLLRAIQLSQSNNHQVHGTSNVKVPPSVQRRTLLDELSCLQCLLNCCSRYSEAVRKLTSTSAGLFTLAVCIMSNVNKSRIIALQLLSRACDPKTSGHSAVSEAMSTLRLRFGEPVRFRFLVGMLSSASGQKELLASGMRFLNKFLDSAGSTQQRLYIQSELEQAGLDVDVIKKNVGNNLNNSEPLMEELDHWSKNHIDVETLAIRLRNSEKENDGLRDKILLLERKVQILQEEKGILRSLEQCLKERCTELQVEVHSLKSVKSQNNSSSSHLHDNKDGSTPEDEGISSSERSITPDEDNIQRESSVYELYSLQSDTVQLKIKPPQIPSTETLLNDDEEDTTIEEVMEELRNIINDAETEAYNKEETEKNHKERKKIEEAQIAGKFQTCIDVDDYAFSSSEIEIIPSNLHPQPPRKARSLVQLFVHSEDYGYHNKEFFFENETAFTSDEGSDSLLSASRYRNVEKIFPKTEDKKEKRKCKRQPSRTGLKRSESFKRLPKSFKTFQNTSCEFYEEKTRYSLEKFESTDNRTKCKSLEELGDGFDALVDVVVTNSEIRNDTDSGNRTATASGTFSGTFKGTALSRTVSNVFLPKREIKSVGMLSVCSEEKQKMFLPTSRTNSSGEVPYYFPRLQEKRTSAVNGNFMIKRGHVNAGLYSGRVLVDREREGTLKGAKDFSIVNGCERIGKVTDLPSGLY